MQEFILKYGQQIDRTVENLTTEINSYILARDFERAYTCAVRRDEIIKGWNALVSLQRKLETDGQSSFDFPAV
jgi:hypothetical protein